jgi:hypothetical protein
MDILYKVMDQTLIDSTGTRCGRVDDIVVEDEFDRPPLVTALLAGGGVKAQQLWPPLRTLVHILYRMLGMQGPLKPATVPWDVVDHLDRDLFLKCTAYELGLDAVNTAVAARIIGRIPGAKS